MEIIWRRRGVFVEVPAARTVQQLLKLKRIQDSDPLAEVFIGPHEDTAALVPQGQYVPICELHLESAALFPFQQETSLAAA